MNVPDYIGPLIGWRAWSHIDEENRLHAIAFDFWWEPGKIAQTCCSVCCGPAKPSIHTTCGLHAFRTFAQLCEDHLHKYIVFGQVYLWGHIVECERGYRAEFAYPKALVISDTLPTVFIERFRAAWAPVEVVSLNVMQMIQAAKEKARRKSVDNPDLGRT